MGGASHLKAVQSPLLTQWKWHHTRDALIPGTRPLDPEGWVSVLALPRRVQLLLPWTPPRHLNLSLFHSQIPTEAPQTELRKRQRKATVQGHGQPIWYPLCTTEKHPFLKALNGICWKTAPEIYKSLGCTLWTGTARLCRAQPARPYAVCSGGPVEWEHVYVCVCVSMCLGPGGGGVKKLYICIDLRLYWECVSF